MKKSLLIWLCLFAALTANALLWQDIPLPPQGSYVSNADGILSEQTVFELNQTLDSLAITKGVLVWLVAANTIGDNEIHTFATELGQKRGVGKDNSDNGLVILFVLDQRKIDFSVGYGLEGTLTDLISKRIQTEEMLPFFRKGDYNGGMLAGINRVVAVVKGDYQPTNEDLYGTPTDWETVFYNLAIGVLAVMLVTFLLMTRMVTKVQNNTQLTTNIDRVKVLRRNKSSVYLLVFGLILVAAFGGFLLLEVGYLFFLLPLMPVSNVPSIVFSRFYLKKFRTAPIPCAECGKMMHFLPESKEDIYLSVSQQFEEKLHAVDYDVFECENCGNETVYPYETASSYQPCPSCGTRAYRLAHKETTMPATCLSAGNLRETYCCKYCGYEQFNNKKIPRLAATPVFIGGTGGGAFSSGRGGFSGGGSFGGGSFGGGGASSGW